MLTLLSNLIHCIILLLAFYFSYLSTLKNGKKYVTFISSSHISKKLKDFLKIYELEKNYVVYTDFVNLISRPLPYVVGQPSRLESRRVRYALPSVAGGHTLTSPLLITGYRGFPANFAGFL